MPLAAISQMLAWHGSGAHQQTRCFPRSGQSRALTYGSFRVNGTLHVSDSIGYHGARPEYGLLAGNGALLPFGSRSSIVVLATSAGSRVLRGARASVWLDLTAWNAHLRCLAQDLWRVLLALARSPITGALGTWHTRLFWLARGKWRALRPRLAHHLPGTRGVGGSLSWYWLAPLLWRSLAHWLAR